VPGSDGNAYACRWTGLLDDDLGDDMEMPGLGDKSVQVEGTFDGAACVLEGSNDGSAYHTLTDPQGNAISFDEAGLKAVTENTRYVRPSVVDGGASTNLAVTVVARR
jgi:hypothetical protein